MSEVVMHLELGHHVYSSMRGYRTLYASPWLPSEAAARAEDVARRIYRLVGAGPLRGFYLPVPGLAAGVRAASCGTDDAGRARICVHTVFLRQSGLAGIPWFNPLALPEDLFADEIEDFQHVGADLRTSWDVPEEGPGPAEIWSRDRRAVDPKLLQILVPAILDGRHPTLVLDSTDRAYGLTALLAYATPPAVRRNLTYLRGAMVPPGRPFLFRINFFANRPDPSALHGDEIVLDFDREESHNDPERNAFSDFVIRSLAPGGNATEVWRLTAALERLEPDRPLSALGYVLLLRGFSMGEGAFGEDGGIRVPAVPGNAIDAVPLFIQAGCLRLAAAILREVGPSAVDGLRTTKPDVARTLGSRFDELRARPSTAPAPNDVFLLSLVADLRTALRKGKSAAREPSADDTWVQPMGGDEIDSSLRFDE